MKVSTPDKFFCDICNSEKTEREIEPYVVYRKDSLNGKGRQLVKELDVCESCEPANSFFDCDKKRSLVKIIIEKFFTKGKV